MTSPTDLPVADRTPVIGHYCFNVNWGPAAREELLRLGQILSSWRSACRWGRIDGPADALRNIRTYLKVTDEDVDLLKAVGLCDYSKFRLGAQTFDEMSPRKPAEVAAASDVIVMHSKERDDDDVELSVEYGPDVEALARLLSLVMCRHPKETGSRLVFTYAEIRFPEDGQDAGAKGGVVMVKPRGYRIQTLQHLSAELQEHDFWIDDDVEIVLQPAKSYRLPANLIEEYERRLAAGRSPNLQP